ncbi:SGNH/GDSL hydrolase family protein [Cellulomonas pakistanensis]|uniref:Lysophospholipase n=1 Tax=Cellulomonas pakistanensis TaxID=992287 RepID=A0A919PGF9_9CELL|nr:SGNH/GDSL hydrolase family protein [Cellulomonas pakistanensis]GIG38047.1 lysophospholipase [Cellulomonas pakistanensis]
MSPATPAGEPGAPDPGEPHSGGPAPTHVLLVGDSVTDCGRRADPEALGDGYVRLLAEGPLSGCRVTNRGVGGDRAVDLAARWDADVLAERPDVLSVLVGINDTWRRYDRGRATPAEAFETTYRALLGSALAAGVRRLVLVEPFVLPVTAEQERWWDEDLGAKVAAVHRLAAEHGAVLVPAGTHLAALAAAHGARALAADGVHPTAAGHRALADLWWAAAGGSVRRG